MVKTRSELHQHKCAGGFVVVRMVVVGSVVGSVVVVVGVVVVVVANRVVVRGMVGQIN